MDIIDNIIYANSLSPLQPSLPIPPGLPGPTNRITSDYVATFPIPAAPPNVGSVAAPVFNYPNAVKMDFCAYEDPAVIESTSLRHWHDITNQVNYDQVGVRPFNTPQGGVDRFSTFERCSNYHLISAYLLENTRLLQIFEKLIEKYLRDEEFGIAGNPLAFNWIQNSERLFFKNDASRSTNIRSLIRPDSGASRRNAYWRMFGMDLAFGEMGSPSFTQPEYFKARVSNQQFVALFEKYLSEIWQGYINANNTSGVNTADIDIVVTLATQLRELLIARRGSAVNRYAHQNLSREEFSSVFMTSWFTFVISDDTPLVQFLSCESSTIGERLAKIGAKVGVPAHAKSQSLFEMAGAASTILSTIEVGGVLDNAAVMPNILRSLIPPVAPSVNANYMTDLLTVINHWEKATGHRIKNPEANIRGTVSILQPRPANGRPVAAPVS
jgi:hypothetical protein